jgi:membrane fusion protein, multidrug efflux system
LRRTIILFDGLGIMILRFIIALILVGVLAGGLVFFNGFRSKMINNFFANMPIPTQTISATAVTATDWSPGVEAIGTAKAFNGVDLAVEVSGVVKEIAFQSTQKVKAGQVLIHLDDAVERAEMIAVEADIRLKEKTLDRARTLRTQGAGTAVNLDTAVADLDNSRSQMAKLRATLDKKVLRAPFDGIIGIVQVDVGGYVAAGTAVATLQDLDRIKVDFPVPEQSLGKIRMGQPVSFGADVAEVRWHGEVIGIDPKVDSTSRMMTVQAVLNNADAEVLPGQFLRVRVEMPVEHGVITVPQTAVITSLYGDFVYVVESKPGVDGGPATNVARQVFVKTGRRDKGVMELLDGVQAGQQVVTAGQNKLFSGAPVVVNNAIDPSSLAMQ